MNKEVIILFINDLKRHTSIKQPIHSNNSALRRFLQVYDEILPKGFMGQDEIESQALESDKFSSQREELVIILQTLEIKPSDEKLANRGIEILKNIQEILPIVEVMIS